jgi:competence protein ComEC
MNRPLLVLTVFYAAGVLLGEFTDIKASAALLLAFFCYLVAAAGYITARWDNRRVILVLFLLLGLALVRLEVEASRTALVDYAGGRVVLTGQVAGEPDARENQVFYLLRAREVVAGGERRAVSGLVRLALKDSDRVYRYGDLLRVDGLLARPGPAGNPGLFDYRTYLERQGVRVLLSARGGDAVQKTGAGGNPVYGAVLRLKERLAAAAAAELAPARAAVLNGIVFGSRGLIAEETLEVFSEVGIVHILCVSGMHVGLVLGGVIAFFRLLQLPPGLTAPLATPVLLLYAVMTGAGPAVLRATIMALLLLWAHYLGRERDWPTTLALAALVLLLWKPRELFTPGFQLSFAATWGILYLGPGLNNFLSGLLRGLPAGLNRAAAPGIAVPLAAQLATVPLVAWYYNLISVVSIPVNLLAVPLVGLILFLGVLAALLGVLWLPLAGLVNAATGAVLDLFLGLVGWFRQLPGAVRYLATPPVLLVGAWYAGLLAAAGLRPGKLSADGRERVKGWLAVAAALAVVLLLIWWPWTGGQRLAVHFLDVGQGDSILLQSPGGKNMLIDTGGWRDEYGTGTGAGDRVVAPYLRKIGVQRLDALVLTHPHEDHCGGAAYLVEKFPVRLAVVSPAGAAGGSGGQEEIPGAYRELLEKMSAAGIPVRAAAAGDLLRLDDKLKIEVFAPDEAAGKGAHNLNDCSLVLKVTYGRRSFLFTGDIEIAAQESLLRRKVPLEADVLKVPHHGSRLLLPGLVERVDPGVAVISVGAHNNFGHPAWSTLELLDCAGLQVYRTDRDGAVIVQTDGNYLKASGTKGPGE